LAADAAAQPDNQAHGGASEHVEFDLGHGWHFLQVARPS
jgi:hypothetical protein